MKFCWTSLYVNNMEESLKFYQEIVGLKIDRKLQAGPTMDIVFLGDGETKIELIADQSKNKVDLGKDILMGFTIDSVEEKLAFLKSKGINIHSGPFQPTPQTKFFFVEDPNGLKIQFVQIL
ncbi:MAG: VOC family protein [Spirochaetes bacterium]|nr:VOC family protein [Spirochaetota bacterium]